MVARLGDLPAALFLEDVHVARVVQRARSKSRATKFRTAYVCVHFWVPSELRIGDEWIFLRDSGNF